MWTATGQPVNYVNWSYGQPKFVEGEGHAIMLGLGTHKMLVERIILDGRYYVEPYICEKNTFINGLRNSQMEQKSCSAGSDWTCRNEVTGCYCHQTIKVKSSFSLFDNL